MRFLFFRDSIRIKCLYSSIVRLRFNRNRRMMQWNVKRNKIFLEKSIQNKEETG